MTTPDSGEIWTVDLKLARRIKKVSLIIDGLIVDFKSFEATCTLTLKQTST